MQVCRSSDSDMWQFECTAHVDVSSKTKLKDIRAFLHNNNPSYWENDCYDWRFLSQDDLQKRDENNIEFATTEAEKFVSATNYIQDQKVYLVNFFGANLTDVTINTGFEQYSARLNSGMTLSQLRRIISKASNECSSKGGRQLFPNDVVLPSKDGAMWRVVNRRKMTLDIDPPGQNEISSDLALPSDLETSVIADDWMYMWNGQWAIDYSNIHSKSVDYVGTKVSELKNDGISVRVEKRCDVGDSCDKLKPIMLAHLRSLTTQTLFWDRVVIVEKDTKVKFFIEFKGFFTLTAKDSSGKEIYSDMVCEDECNLTRFEDGRHIQISESPIELESEIRNERNTLVFTVTPAKHVTLNRTEGVMQRSRRAANRPGNVRMSQGSHTMAEVLPMSSKDEFITKYWNVAEKGESREIRFYIFNFANKEIAKKYVAVDTLKSY